MSEWRGSAAVGRGWVGERRKAISAVMFIWLLLQDTLEVKWYFRYDPTPIYQWVPPFPPQVNAGVTYPSNLKHDETFVVPDKFLGNYPLFL